MKLFLISLLALSSFALSSQAGTIKDSAGQSLSFNLNFDVNANLYSTREPGKFVPVDLSAFELIIWTNIFQRRMANNPVQESDLKSDVGKDVAKTAINTSRIVQQTDLEFESIRAWLPVSK
jgi:hypothetical protein